MLREVLGIDGLRQDVLYPPDKENVKDTIGNYYINPLELIGIGEILKDHQLSEDNQQYIMLPKVTAVFPSITLASWASIFTGKMPNETGITGNEFFDRSTGRVVTFADGAFPMMSILKRYPIPNLNNVSGIGEADRTLSAEVQTVYESVKAIFPDLRIVTVMHNYSRGADEWLYQESLIDKLKFAWDVKVKPNESEIARLMDSSPAQDSVNYILQYMESPEEEDEWDIGEDLRFPILFAVYFPGVDHWAHELGMDSYVEFFEKETDNRIKEIADALREVGEFDNKIFIITADHGHTAMPHPIYYKDPKDGQQKEADTSCKLNIKDFDKENTQNKEKYNNNLHIWELGEVLKAVGEYGLGQYKVLAPKEIAELYKKKDRTTKQIGALPYGATDKVETADIIVGFNGPMAHVYVADINKLGEVAELFRVSFESHTTEAAKWWDMDELDYLDFKENMIGRLKESIDKILVRIGQEKDSYYCVFDGLNDDKSLKCADTDQFVSMDYVNAWERIEGMNNPDRSGDIVLIMKDKTTSDAIERYTTGTACKSWHGSLNPSDSYVPLIVAYPGGNKKEIEEILRKDTLCKADYSGCKGNWKLTDIVKEIIKEQYQ